MKGENTEAWLKTVRSEEVIICWGHYRKDKTWRCHQIKTHCLSEYAWSLDSVSSLTLLISHIDSYNFGLFNPPSLYPTEYQNSTNSTVEISQIHPLFLNYNKN